MAAEYNPFRLSSPSIYLVIMLIVVIICGLIGFVLIGRLSTPFMANPYLNGFILTVLLIGIILNFRQVTRLFPEVKWVNSLRVGEQGFADIRQPRLLAPMASLIGDRLGSEVITPMALRSILDSVATRLDEARDISRYMVGLLVFLGLLGTFWGLLQTIASVGETIGSLTIDSDDSAGLILSLKEGLQAPLSGMNTAFASSLFGLTGSLILGFLDLQASQAQNRFFTELEDWLSSLTDIGVGEGFSGHMPEKFEEALTSLNEGMLSGQTPGTAVSAMGDLAEGIRGLVEHMRSDQQVLKNLAELQSEQNTQLSDLIGVLSQVLEERKDQG